MSNSPTSLSEETREQGNGPDETAPVGRTPETPEEHRTEVAGDAARMTSLLRRLVDNVAVLVRTEAALAASEFSRSIAGARQGATSAVSGAAVLHAGLLFLLLAATLGLALYVPPWAAALIVGGVVSLIGLVLLQSGRKKMSTTNFAPSRAAGAVRRDRNIFRRHTP